MIIIKSWRAARALIVLQGLLVTAVGLNHMLGYYGDCGNEPG